MLKLVSVFFLDIIVNANLLLVFAFTLALTASYRATCNFLGFRGAYNDLNKNPHHVDFHKHSPSPDANAFENIIENMVKSLCKK